MFKICWGKLIFSCFIGLCCLGGFIFLSLGSYALLSEGYGNDKAALMMGGLFFILGAFLGILKLALRRKKQPLWERFIHDAKSFEKQAEQTLEVIKTKSIEQITKNPLLTAVICAGTGIILAKVQSLIVTRK